MTNRLRMALRLALALIVGALLQAGVLAVVVGAAYALRWCYEMALGLVGENAVVAVMLMGWALMLTWVFVRVGYEVARRLVP